MFDAKLFQYLTGNEVQLLPTMYDNVAIQYSNELDEFALLKSSHAGFINELYSNFTAECNLVIFSSLFENKMNDIVLSRGIPQEC